MDAAGDDDYGLSLADQFIDRGLARVREQARIGQFALNFLELIEPLQIFRRRDRGDDERPPQSRFAESLQFDAVARLRKFAEIGQELIPFRQLAVFADLESQRGFRRGDYCCDLSLAPALDCRRAGTRRNVATESVVIMRDA